MVGCEAITSTCRRASSPNCVLSLRSELCEVVAVCSPSRLPARVKPTRGDYTPWCYHDEEQGGERGRTLLRLAGQQESNTNPAHHTRRRTIEPTLTHHVPEPCIGVSC